MNGRNYLPQGERSAFDEGVRQGADFLAIIRWANYDEKTALYITAPLPDPGRRHRGRGQ